jgi:hypothetical protein
MQTETENNTENKQTPAPATTKSPEPGVQVTAASLFAGLLIIAFFLPWISFFGIALTGWQFCRIQEGSPFVLLFPIAGVITIFVGLAGGPQRSIAQISGALPLLGFVYIFAIYKTDELLQILSIGAYLSLISGVLLIFSPYLRSASAQTVKG